MAILLASETLTVQNFRGHLNYSTFKLFGQWICYSFSENFCPKYVQINGKFAIIYKFIVWLLWILSNSCSTVQKWLIIILSYLILQQLFCNKKSASRAISMWLWQNSLTKQNASDLFGQLMHFLFKLFSWIDCGGTPPTSLSVFNFQFLIESTARVFNFRTCKYCYPNLVQQLVAYSSSASSSAVTSACGSSFAASSGSFRKQYRQFPQ